MNRQPLPVAEDDSDRMLLADIEKLGWHTIGIEGDDEGPQYAFTVGLHHSFEHPEIMLFGLDPEIASQLVSIIVQHIKQGERFEDGDICEEIAEGLPVAFRTVTEEYYREYVGYAIWFYRSTKFPLLQCIWPDENGKFPWEDDCDEDCIELQQLVLRD